MPIIRIQEYHLYDWRSVLRNLYILQQGSKFCDISLLTDNGCVAAHKMLLASRVPYFQTMFASTLTTREVMEADLTQFTKHTVEQVIKFVYVGELEVDDVDELIQVFCLADYLQMSLLREQCEDYIFSSLALQTCVHVANFSQSYSSVIKPHNSTKILNYFLSHWNYIAKTNDWTALSYQFFHKLVISDVFNVRNEQHVLTAVLQWISADPNRRDKLHTLFQDVRLHAIAENDLDSLAYNPLVKSSQECLRLIEEGRYFASTIKTDTAIRLKPRTYIDKSVYLFCMYKPYPPEVQYPRPSFNNVPCPHARDSLSQQYKSQYASVYNTSYNNCNVLVYSKIHDHWEELVEEPSRSWSQGTVVAPLHDTILMIGSRQWQFGEPSPEDEVYDKVVAFDRLSLSWDVQGRLPFPILFNAGGTIAGHLFTCGGLNLLSDVREYCVSTMLVYSSDGWEYMNDMSCGRRNHGAVTVCDKVYVTGGETKGSELNPCPCSESWDPVKNMWTSFANPNNNRTKLCATSSSDRMFAFGGFNLNPDEFCNDYTWESYDPRIGKWEQPKQLPGKYTDFTVVCLDHEIFMMGGSLIREGEDHWTRDMHVYDVRNDKWRRGPDLPARPAPELCEIEQLLNDVVGVEYPNVPIPSGSAVLN